MRSRAGYYAWQSELETKQQQRDRTLMPLVCDIFWHQKRRYGARQIAVELQARGRPVRRRSRGETAENACLRGPISTKTLATRLSEVCQAAHSCFCDMPD